MTEAMQTIKKRKTRGMLRDAILLWNVENIFVWRVHYETLCSRLFKRTKQDMLEEYHSIPIYTN